MCLQIFLHVSVLRCDGSLAPSVLLQLTPDGRQRADTSASDMEAVAGAQNLTNTNSSAAQDTKVHVTHFHDYD
jgi:hypothetical protein